MPPEMLLFHEPRASAEELRLRVSNPPRNSCIGHASVRTRPQGGGRALGKAHRPRSAQASAVLRVTLLR